MEWDHLGIKTLKHAIYTKNVFKKMQENQITTYFIFPISSNFRKSIYTNYLDYFLKFQNGPFGMDKSGLSQFTMLHKAARVPKPKLVPQKLSHIIGNNIGNGGRKIRLRIYVRNYSLCF